MKRFKKRQQRKKFKFNRKILDSRVEQMAVFTDYISDKKDKETPFPLHILSHQQFMLKKDNAIVVGGYQRTGSGAMCRTMYSNILHVGKM